MHEALYTYIYIYMYMSIYVCVYIWIYMYIPIRKKSMAGVKNRYEWKFIFPQISYA